VCLGVCPVMVDNPNMSADYSKNWAFD
jgi:hypothetical protein